MYSVVFIHYDKTNFISILRGTIMVTLRRVRNDEVTNSISMKTESELRMTTFFCQKD